MPSQLPSPFGSTYLAWTDLAAAVRSHPLLAAIAIIACAATSNAYVYLNPAYDESALAITVGFGLAVTEVFLMTPVLLAAHRFVILGETAQDYIRALFTLRFWRFFLLSAAIVAMLFVPVLVTSLRVLSEDFTEFAFLIVAIIGFVAAGLLLSLLFPAIAVDAPGAGPRNAVTDLWGNVWRFFFVGLLAMLPFAIAITIVGHVQHALIEKIGALPVHLAFAPLDGALSASIYVLLMLVASRFYLALGTRLRQLA